MHSIADFLTFPGYNFTPQNVANDSATASAYHKIIETFKYAYARRALLGDKNFANVTEVGELNIQLHNFINPTETFKHTVQRRPRIR